MISHKKLNPYLNGPIIWTDMEQYPTDNNRLQRIIETVAEKAALPVAFSSDRVNNGIFGETEECLIMYHPNHYNDYYKFCFRLSSPRKGTYHIKVDTFGTSKQMKLQAKAEYCKEWRKGRSTSEKIGNYIGQGLSSIGKSKRKLQSEEEYYALVEEVIISEMAAFQGFPEESDAPGHDEAELPAAPGTAPIPQWAPPGDTVTKWAPPDGTATQYAPPDDNPGNNSPKGGETTPEGLIDGGGLVSNSLWDKIRNLPAVAKILSIVIAVGLIFAVIFVATSCIRHEPIPVAPINPPVLTATPTLPVLTATPTPRELTIGQTFTLGRWEQDNNANNGAEEIAWRVLAIQDGKALVISTKCLDSRAFSDGTTAWGDSYLRRWLNSEFYTNAFTAEEKSFIRTNEDTGDEVFLLSTAEVSIYFDNNADRTAELTAYAEEVQRTAYRQAGMGYNPDGWWWLRDAGTKNGSAAGVYQNGTIDYEGGRVDHAYNLVRPAMWVDVYVPEN